MIEIDGEENGAVALAPRLQHTRQADQLLHHLVPHPPQVVVQLAVLQRIASRRQESVLRVFRIERAYIYVTTL